jgi:hypothetical protein
MATYGRHRWHTLSLPALVCHFRWISCSLARSPRTSRCGRRAPLYKRSASPVTRSARAAPQDRSASRRHVSAAKAGSLDDFKYSKACGRRARRSRLGPRNTRPVSRASRAISSRATACRSRHELTRRTVQALIDGFVRDTIKRPVRWSAEEVKHFRAGEQLCRYRSGDGRRSGIRRISGGRVRDLPPGFRPCRWHSVHCRLAKGLLCHFIV